jgi:uncharacterized iron-regulated protein
VSTRLARIAALCTGLVAACPASGASTGDVPDLWDARARRPIPERELVAALAGARHRLLGETHDNPAHHSLRARLVAGVAAAGKRPAVVLEQFDLDHDDALRQAQRSPTDAEALADAGALDRKAWRWPLHKPIFETALAHRLPLRAGNASRAQLRTGERPPIAWERRLAEAPWGEARDAALRAGIVEAHCGKLPDDAVPRIVRAQRLRDAAMAQALVEAATADGAILIAGNGHVRNDLGVPIYLPAHEPSVSVGFVESDDADASARERMAAALAGRFDYVWFTAPVPRDDPCAGAR